MPRPAQLPRHDPGRLVLSLLVAEAVFAVATLAVVTRDAGPPVRPLVLLALCVATLGLSPVVARLATATGRAAPRPVLDDAVLAGEAGASRTVARVAKRIQD